MTYRPDSRQYVPESACEDLDSRRRYGWLLGHDAEGVLEFVDGDHGTPGVDGDGGLEAIAVRRHPEMLRLEHPELAGVVDRFQVGALRKVTGRDYVRLSAFEVACVLAMSGAWGREQRREIARMREAREGRA